MARPRVLKLPNGVEILVKNGTPELMEQLKRALEPTEEKPTLPTPAAPQPVAAKATLLAANAVGISEYNGEYFVDKIQYDPVLGQAVVVSHVSAGYDRGYAGERFKITAAESDLV
jgi:hypothetical protein